MELDGNFLPWRELQVVHSASHYWVVDVSCPSVNGTFLEIVSSYSRNARVHISVVSFIVFGTVITFTEGLGKSEDNSYPGWTFKFIPENLSWHERQE